MPSVVDDLQFSLLHISKDSYERLELVDIVYDYWTVSFVLEGSLHTETRGFRYAVGAGDVMIHPPKIPFTEIAAGGGTHIYLMLDVKLSPGVSFFTRFPMPQVIAVPDPARFAQRLETLLALFQQPDSAGRRLRLISYTLQILADLHEVWEAAGSLVRPKELGSENDRFSSIIDFMEQHLHEKLTRDELAKRLHLHPGYFHRAFKQVYGISCMQMLKAMRLKRAMKLLDSSGETLEAVAARCGFGDAAHLHRVFRQHVGTTPGDYRRSLALAREGLAAGSFLPHGSEAAEAADGTEAVPEA